MQLGVELVDNDGTAAFERRQQKRRQPHELLSTGRLLGQAQLIFSSQDVSTMRNDVFRRDEIWFAARGEGEASQLWSLADIHEANGNLVSKNAAFDKQYLSGRYGADPYLTCIEEWD